jgi:membrane fusion protein (multidrug efflux system)
LKEPSTGKPRRNGLRRRPVVSAIGALLLASALGVGYLYLDEASRIQSTDDASVAARQSAVAPKVSGYIAAVPVTDNQHVKTGDVIARIDDRDYRTALEQAEAQVASAQAQYREHRCAARPAEGPDHCQPGAGRSGTGGAGVRRAAGARYEHLGQTGYGSVQNAQQYSQLHQQQAALASAQATLKLAQRQVEALKAQRSGAVASLGRAEAQRDQAKLNLSYTIVTAAQPGRVVNLTAAVGQFVQPGADLTMFVPDQIWATANFKRRH